MCRIKKSKANNIITYGEIALETIEAQVVRTFEVGKLAVLAAHILKYAERGVGRDSTCEKPCAKERKQTQLQSGGSTVKSTFK